MDSWFDLCWLLPLALGMDLLWGDPPLPWRHPVCWTGQLIGRLEAPARKRGRAGGVLAVTAAVGLTVCIVAALTALPGICGLICAVYLSWAGLAMGSLLAMGEDTLRVFERGSLPDARKALARLVSRDTSVLDWNALHKSLADTMAENLTDAMVAPLFWLTLGGPVGLWAYKTVSTFDSMWGYTTDRWRDIGWAGARLDDLLAWIPARISVFCLWLADKIFRFSAPSGGRWPGFATVARQAGTLTSPNSGWPMTAAAWLLHGRMAGPTVYFGELLQKPWLGPDDAPPWNPPRLRALFRALRLAGMLAAALFWLLPVLVRAVF